MLARLGKLELAARFAVEGFFTGLHRSPFHGFSVEYSDHRNYRPGDDLKYLDWKAYARSDRLYVKQFLEETNTTVHLLLDASGSMGFASQDVTKLEYACFLSAALSYLALRQNDAAGLTVFADTVKDRTTVSSRRTHLHTLLKALHGVKAGGRTNLAANLHAFAERAERRGMVVIVSDFFDREQDVREGLAHLRHRGHDVICLHVLDPREVEFDYRGLIEFRDMETGAPLRVSAEAVRGGYRKQMAEFLRDFGRFCGRNEIDHCLLTTSESPERALPAYLNRRKKMV